MKYLPFQIIVLCLLLPPILYAFSIQSLETYLTDHYAKEIESVYIGDMQPILEGRVRLKDAINNNIDLYLKSQKLLSLGIDLFVTVKTKKNIILYPSAFDELTDAQNVPGQKQVASNNFDLLNDGINVGVKIAFERFAPIAFLLFLFLAGFALLVLLYYYNTGLRKAKLDEIEKHKEIESLKKLEKKLQNKFASLQEDKKKISGEFSKIKRKYEHERISANRNEDEMINEIVKLENKIESQYAQVEEIEHLKDKIKQYEKRDKKQKQKTSESIQKRFRVLYKQIQVDDKAVEGFIDLPEELEIKGEEVLHMLNADPNLVTVKRKVYGKKGRKSVMEVKFAYYGRLYFQKTKENRVRVLNIGTKKTQTKDLIYLEKFS